jgi:hypothetical protein
LGFPLTKTKDGFSGGPNAPAFRLCWFFQMQVA